MIIRLCKTFSSRVVLIQDNYETIGACNAGDRVSLNQRPNGAVLKVTDSTQDIYAFAARLVLANRALPGEAHGWIGEFR